MTIELSLLLTGVSVAFALYFGLANVKRNQKSDVQKATAEQTAMLIKLENIQNGITEIKSDMRSVKEDIDTVRDRQTNDIAEVRERLAKVEASSAQAHKRLDEKNGGQRNGHTG